MIHKLSTALFLCSSLVLNLYTQDAFTIDDLLAQTTGAKGIGLTLNATIERNENVPQNQWNDLIDRVATAFDAESLQSISDACPFIRDLQTMEGITGSYSLYINIVNRCSEDTPSLEEMLAQAKEAQGITLTGNFTIERNETVTQDQWNTLVGRIGTALTPELLETMCNNCPFLSYIQTIEGLNGNCSLQIGAIEFADSGCCSAE